MAPAPYHRIVYAGEDTEDMYRVGSALVTGATLPLGLGLAGDVYVVEAGGLEAGEIEVAVSLSAGIRAVWLVPRAPEIPPPAPKAWTPDGGL